MDKNILLSHIRDLAQSVKRGKAFAFSEFLSFEELQIAKDVANNSGVSYTIFGGFDDAQRNVIGFGCTNFEQNLYYPIATICFDIKPYMDIKHSSVLGALMSLGIKRECIGDIIFFNNKCCIFVLDKMSDFVVSNLTSVSKYPISLFYHYDKVEYTPKFEQIDIIVPSMRLDCIVSEIIKSSRKTASEIIESRLVFVNGKECVKKDKTVNCNDILTVRKFGKFKIDSTNGVTKKDRIKLKILKYI